MQAVTWTHDRRTARSFTNGCVVGIDLYAKHVALASEHLGSNVGARVSLVACDFLHLPFVAAFNVIVSTAAFHWVRDHATLLRICIERLSPEAGWKPNAEAVRTLARLRDRADALAATPKFAPYFEGFHKPWLFEDARRRSSHLEGAPGIRRCQDFSRGHANYPRQCGSLQ